MEKVKNGKGAFGFNAETEEYGDMVEAGVIDPTKVVRFALQNAASVASLMLTTEAIIAEKPKKKAPRCPVAADGDGWHGRYGRHGWYGRHGRYVLITVAPPSTAAFWYLLVVGTVSYCAHHGHRGAAPCGPG